MHARLSNCLLAPLVLLGLMTALGCGGGGGPGPGVDTDTDGGDADAIGDVLPDGGEDVPADTPADTPTDVEDDDGGTTSGALPFQVETSGGAKVSSATYNLEVFIGPVRPVGSSSSTNYIIKVGPGAIRSH